MKKLLFIILCLCTVAAATQLSFNSGRHSPLMKYRVDVDNHSMAMEQMTNVAVQAEGMAAKRPGSEFVSVCPDEIVFLGTEVAGDYTQYLVGIYPYSGNQIVAMGKDDSTIDTTWGASGYWDATPNSGPEYCMYQLDDGRVLVAHNYYKVTMINTDGTTDTTWATSGTYTMPSTGVNVYSILEDSDGNFHLFGGVAGSTAYYVYVKLDSDGAYLGGLTRLQTYLRIIYDAVWSDSNKTRIIAAGAGVDALGGLLPNLVAINPSTIAVDTTWTGNISGNPGYAQYDTGAGNETTNFKIFAMSDGGFVLYRNTSKMLIKILSDGSALDTTWATNGELTITYASFPYNEAHNPTQDGDELYLITVITDGVAKNKFYHIDASGASIDTFTTTNDPDGGYASYYSVTIFNDQLLFGHAGYVELWDADFTYISRFAVANTNIVWWIIPDETTREYTSSTVTLTLTPGSGVRLIPFEYSTDDAYVLEFGHEYVGFLRTTQ